MSRLVLFGGTFNPPHRSHRRILAQAMRELEAPRALVLPVGRHPLKADTDLAPDAARMELCRLAFDGLDGVAVDDLDMHGSGPHYTVDTLRRLRERHPDDELFWLIGSDNLHILGSWHDHHRLLRLATLVTFPRLGYPVTRAMLARQDLAPEEIEQLLAHVLSGDPDATSATAIRAALRDDRLPPELDSRVVARIRELGFNRA